MGLEFVLFLILGVVLFVPLEGNARLVALVFYAVIMALWLLGAFNSWPVLHWPR